MAHSTPQQSDRTTSTQSISEFLMRLHHSHFEPTGDHHNGLSVLVPLLVDLICALTSQAVIPLPIDFIEWWTHHIKHAEFKQNR